MQKWLLLNIFRVFYISPTLTYWLFNEFDGHNTNLFSIDIKEIMLARSLVKITGHK